MTIRLFTLIAVLPIPYAWAADFPPPYNSEKDKTANPPPPAEAAASFQLPEGLKTTVFAAEPDVQNPIAMTWDHRGRMWVAENYTYAEQQKRFDLDLRDRIIILEDKDHDGQAETRTVFADNLQMLTSVETTPDGVYAMCPPQLLFIPDKNHDDIPDSEPQVILDGFTVAQSNYHNFANGLRWGPDGWLYGRCGGSCPGLVGQPGAAEDQRVPLEGGIWRFHPTRKTFEVLCHGTTNPWGHDWDENGEMFFVNTVSGHLWHMIPGAHYDRPFNPSPNKNIFEAIQMHADHWHFDRNGTWRESRDGAANDFGGGHSHIGTCIYQGGQFPDYWNGKLLTWNQHGRRLNVERLERDGSGYVGKHEPDAFISGDEWFRGLDIRTGPEGALYALDWSDTGECHDHTGVHRTSGRIYRFSYGDPPKPDLDLLQNIDAEKLTKIIEHPNAWYERQARRLIKSDPSLIEAAGKLLESGNTAIRLRALWSLHEMGAAQPEALLNDPDEHLRAWGIRLLTEEFFIDHAFGLHPQNQEDLSRFTFMLLHFAANNDSSALVRLTLASTLQRFPLQWRPALAKGLAAREDASDHNLPKLLWFGIAPLLETNPDALVQVAKTTTWPDLLRYISRAMASQPDALVELAIAQPAKAPHILKGLSEGFKGWQKAPLPKDWDKAVEHLSTANPDLIRELSLLFGDGRAMESIRAIAQDNQADILVRSAALQSLIEARPDDLRALCQQFLDTRHLNQTALRGLATFDDPALGKTFLNKIQRYRPEERRVTIDVLVSRPAWANDLLDGLAAERIPRVELTPFHARQIISLGDEKLTEKLRTVWGDVRQSDEAKRKRIEQLHLALTPEIRAKADLAAGKILFKNICSTCHKLYGEGGELGPDLTGSGRADLGYLLENIVDPGAVVSAEFQISVLKLKDGRSLSGVRAAQTDRTLTLRTLAEEMTLEKTEILESAKLPNSIMPEGLIDALTAEQTRDLIAYLMHQHN